MQVTPGLPNVHLWDYSRLSFVNTVLSKRKLTWFVDNGKVGADQLHAGLSRWFVSRARLAHCSLSYLPYVKWIERTEVQMQSEGLPSKSGSMYVRWTLGISWES